MMGKPAKILLASMLVAIISISITGYVYAETVTYQDVDVNRINEHVIIKSANFSSTTNTISIQWEAPVNEPKDYRVTWIEATEENYHSYRLANGNNAYPTESSYTIEGLEEDTLYKIKIRPRYNEAPPGPWTDSVFISTGLTIPEPTPEPTPEPEPEPTPEDHAAEMAQMQAKLDAANAEMAQMQAKLDAANAEMAQMQAKLDAANAEMAQMQAKLDAANTNMTAFKDRLALSQLQVKLWIDPWADYPEDNYLGAAIFLAMPDAPLPESFVRVNGTAFSPGDTITITGKLYEHFEALQTGIFFDPDAGQVERRQISLSFGPYYSNTNVHVNFPGKNILGAQAPGQIICWASGSDYSGDGLTMRTNSERYGYPYCLTDIDDSTFSLTYMIPEDTPAGEYQIFVKHQINWSSMHIAGNYANEDFTSIVFTIN